jgi:hypothetical protein
MMMVMRRMVAHRALPNDTTQHNVSTATCRTRLHGTEQKGSPDHAHSKTIAQLAAALNTPSRQQAINKPAGRGGQAPTAHHAPAILRQGHSLGLAQEETEGAVDGPGLVHALDDDEHGRDGHDGVGGEAVKGWRNVATGRGGGVERADGENEEVG